MQSDAQSLISLYTIIIEVISLSLHTINEATSVFADWNPSTSESGIADLFSCAKLLWALYFTLLHYYIAADSFCSWLIPTSSSTLYFNA